jgi:cytosine/adenosine deaminase-related metal-dependent hydrolase
MRKFIADYIFPVSEKPVKNGILITEDDGNIIDLLKMDALDYAMMDVEYFKGIICPGFVNAHCHLELSYLKGIMPEHQGLNEFIVQLEKIRKFEDDEIVSAAVDAEKEMENNGIVAVGDICNSIHTFEIKNKSALRYYTFVESFSSNPDRAEAAFEKALRLYASVKLNENNSSVSITPHAPYSLSPALFNMIKKFAEDHQSIVTIHHQESEDENKFFRGSEQKISERQIQFGVLSSVFYNTGLRPMPSIEKYLPQENPLMLVHNTVSNREDIAFAKNNFNDLYWCFCPNSNLYIENKLPDFSIFMDEQCKITLGTDSLAANHSLSILDEMKTITHHAPSIELEKLISWATINGAAFLRFDGKLGTLEKGKQPGINLIEGIDTKGPRLLPKSRVRRLV